jgi:hypothetical protein
MEETSEYDTEQALKDAITGKFTGNNKTMIGTGFHKIIEDYKDPQINANFNESQTGLAINYANSLGPHFSEIRHSKEYHVKNHTVVLSGAADVIQGNIVRDIKCTFSKPEYLNYYSSFQWRIYLDIFKLSTFVFDVFEIIGYKESMGLDVSVCKIKQYEPMVMYSYNNMESEINLLIAEFIEWARLSKMDIHLNDQMLNSIEQV